MEVHPGQIRCAGCLPDFYREAERKDTMNKYIEIRKNEYYDSVTLMSLSADIKKREDVENIVVSMGTAMNKELLKRVDLSNEEVQACDENDLMIAFLVDDATDVDEIKALIEQKLKGDEKQKDPTRENYTSLKQALSAEEESNLVVISVPGEYAYREAKTALRAGKNVMLFSDNISIAQEKELKEMAHQKELLVMGPDCGTCMIQGVGLCFANQVARGDIGIAGASGTGMQEVMTLVDEYGGGISNALGVGGRDLSKEIGGRMMKDVLRLLQADEKTKVIVMVSKLPDTDVFDEIEDLIAEEITKPVVFAITSKEPVKTSLENAFVADSLQKAAAKAVELSTGQEVELCDNIIVDQITLAPTQKYIRALYCGGTLCAESFYYLSRKLPCVYSNVSHDKESMLEDVFVSHDHTLLDLGDDQFTNGRPHPMMDPTIRSEKILAECKDPSTAVVLLDFEIGYGSSKDPVGETLEVLKQGQELAAEEGRNIVFVTYVCGTNADFQKKEQQKKLLADNGCIVAESNMEAVRLAYEIIRK